MLPPFLRRPHTPQHVGFQYRSIGWCRIHRSPYATTFMTSRDSGAPRDAYVGIGQITP
jgi:hypothetical protein